LTPTTNTSKLVLEVAVICIVRNMSNLHGFDFLRKEHVLNEGRPHQAAEDAGPAATTTSASAQWDGDALAASVAHKPDLEKQFDVIHFLQAHRSAGCLAPSVIYQRTGIDLQENEAVAKMLQRNPKVRVEHVPDPENPSLMIATYAYQAKYNHVRDRTTLLAQINRCKNGVARRDLEDAYDGVEKDLDSLVTAGDVLAVANTEDKDKILFPRGEAFLVELDGIIHIGEELLGDKEPKKKEETPAGEATTNNSNGDKASSSTSNDPKSNPQQAGVKPLINSVQKRIYVVDVDIDPRTQIRRGEAIQIGGQWFRVSSAIKEGTLQDQPTRAQAPLSVVMLSDLIQHKRNESEGYIRPFSEKKLPVDRHLSKRAIANLQKAKQAREKLLKIAHGRSGGAAGQLLGSHAHSSNPVTLAASFGTATVTSRKRPNKAANMNKAHQHDLEEAQAAASDPNLSLYQHARRHGCTKDVREMYMGTKTAVPESDAELYNLLLKHKLMEPGEQMRRPRLKRTANLDNDGKPKKRRYYERKDQRMTNTHLEGTEIGAVLRRAAEKQQKGEQVGDGGM
jgi:hypothetical protein